MINCITKFLKEGKITQDVADELTSHIKKGSSPEESISKVRKRYKSKPKVKTEIQKYIEEHPDRSPEKHIKDRLAATPGEGQAFHNVENLSESYLHDIFNKHFKTLNQFRNKLFGNNIKKDLLQKMIKVQFKEIDDVEGQALLDEFKTINEAMHKHYVESGGTEPMKNITLSNNAERILQDSKEQFVDNVSPLVNNLKSEIEALYNKAHSGDDIENDVLDFKGSDDYLQYAGKYGNDVFSSLISQIQHKATKTAFNKIFGPSPKAIEDLIKQNNLNASQRRSIENLVNQLLGETNRNVATGNAAKLSALSKGARNIAAASQLGSATLAAVSDLATVLVTADFNGLPIIKTFMNSLKGLGKIENNSQILAQNGIVADNLIHDLAGATRMDVHAGADIMSIATDKVLRASGLMAWTNGIKNAWKLSHLGFLATLPKDISKMNNKVKKQFKAYGITQEVWDNVYKTKGKDFVDLTKLSTEDAHIMRKYINGETQYAILEPNALTSSIMTQGYQSGTLAGETIRAFGQYKSFLLASVMTHFARVLKMTNPMNQMEYMTKMVLAGITIGMFVQALKDTAKGLDPTSRDYSDPKQYVNAIEVSGIGGPALESIVKAFKGEDPLGDFSLSLTPAVGIVTKLVKNGVSDVQSDKDVEIVFGDTMRQVAQSVPGRELFYSQALTNELGRDMMLLVNPEYQKVFNRIDRAKRKRERKDGLKEMNFFE